MAPLILTDARLHLQYADFGILIPIRTSKITKVLEHLEGLPTLQGKAWRTEPVVERVTRADLERAHDRAYVAKLYGPELEDAILTAYELVDADGNHHRYSPEMALKPLPQFFEEVVLLQAAGTYQACKMALAQGWSFFTGGGMHHGHADRGTGFCVVNDIVIALRRLQAEGAIRQAWVIDVDAHKGDGTASICADDPSILTFSIHMAQGWPLDPETTRERGDHNPSQIPSHLDVAQEPGEDRLYLPRLAAALDQLKAMGMDRQGGLPDLVIVVDGADPYEKDELESTSTMKLTLAEMLERDRLVDGFLSNLNIPSAWLNAGGYGDHVWEVYAQFLEEVLPKKLDSHR